MPSPLQHDLRMYLSRRLNRSLAPPDRVSLNVTLRCNLTCSMCTTCYEAPELSTEEIKGIIDQVADWGVQVFNPLGGEPFMRTDFEELLAYAVRRGFYVTVTTNGTLINERRAAALAAIPADRLHFNISLDGDEASHDPIRGAGMWRRAVAGYERIRRADAAAGNSRRKILANTILHRGNLPRFAAILEEQAALGLDGVQILNLFRAGPEPPPEAAALWFQPEQLPALRELVGLLVERARQAPPGTYRIQNPPEELALIPRYYEADLGPLEAPCWAGWKELYINADGKAIMCDGRLDFLAGTFGDVRQQTLRQLWQSPALQARREVVKQCSTPCVQHCYLRRESDSGRALLGRALGQVGQGLRDRLSTLAPGREHHPEAVLRVELTDVCPCGDPLCPTPRARWDSLCRGLPEAPVARNWDGMRDRGLIDFGRGFLGLELLAPLLDDLRAARLSFGTLALAWRGDPLLHPQIEPALKMLAGEVGPGGRAERLRVETTGLTLRARHVELLAGLAVDWWLPLGPEGQAPPELHTLLEARGPRHRVLLWSRARAGLDAAALARRWSAFPPAAGRAPAMERGDALWLRRSDHGHFLANAAARAELGRCAAALGLSAELGEEDQPRRCAAPARSPTISWDGKVLLCPEDRQISQRLGQLTTERFSALWRGAGRAEALAGAASKGVPDQPLCRDCPAPWSPNRDG